MLKIITLLASFCFVIFFVYLKFLIKPENQLIPPKYENIDLNSELGVQLSFQKNNRFTSKIESNFKVGEKLTNSSKPEFSEDAFKNAIIQNVSSDFDFKKIKKGTSISVKNFFDPKLEPSLFTPFWYYDQVVIVSIERQYQPDGEMELAQAGSVKEKGWTKYPPISQSDAESRLLEYIDTSYTYQGLVYDVPHVLEYLFEMPESDELILVNAYTGMVRYLSKNTDSNDNDLSILRMNDQGLIELIPGRIKYISEEEIRDLQKELYEENEAIKKGLLKLDVELNVIYDKRV